MPCISKYPSKVPSTPMGRWVRRPCMCSRLAEPLGMVPCPRVAREDIMHNIKLCQQYDQVQATTVQPPLARSWRLIGAHTGRSKGYADVRCRTAALEPQERSDRRATARSIHPSALASKVTHGPEPRSHPAMPASIRHARMVRSTSGEHPSPSVSTAALVGPVCLRPRPDSQAKSRTQKQSPRSWTLLFHRRVGYSRVARHGR